MTDAPETTSDLDADRPPRAPRWVKVAIAVVLLVVVVLVVSMLLGVEHGPGMHSGSDESPGNTHTGPPPGVTHGSPE